MGQMIQILWNNNDDISSTSNQVIKVNSTEKTICLEKIQLS